MDDLKVFTGNAHPTLAMVTFLYGYWKMSVNGIFMWSSLSVSR
jgi:hypothetical protein